ncbi:MAG: hypothetical protein M3Z51_02440 [Snodgrassella alvi]|nr:hypothetical protein [Snodgrassella alvi]
MFTLPPSSPSASDDFGRVKNITVHFLACNQIFITYANIKRVEIRRCILSYLPKVKSYVRHDRVLNPWSIIGTIKQARSHQERGRKHRAYDYTSI